MAVTHSAWLRKLGRQHEHKAIICHDPSCPITALNALEINLRAAFTEVDTFVYGRPPIPGYPQSANWAFQNIALHMAKQKSPWFFFEADAIALQPDWLEQLQNEYEQCGQDWMGSHVEGMRHANGSMIYPADAAQRMPKAMHCSDQAWDYHGAEDYMGQCHNSRRMVHVWTLVNRMACPVGGGELPANVTAAEISQWLPPGAVYLHRIKDDSLLRLLISGEFRP